MDKVDFGNMPAQQVLEYAQRLAGIQNVQDISQEKLQALFICSQKLLIWFLAHQHAFEREIEESKHHEAMLIAKFKQTHEQIQVLQEQLAKARSSAKRTVAIPPPKPLAPSKQLAAMQVERPSVAYAWFLHLTTAATRIQRVWKGYYARHKFMQLLQTLAFAEVTFTSTVALKKSRTPSPLIVDAGASASLSSTQRSAGSAGSPRSPAAIVPPTPTSPIAEGRF